MILIHIIARIFLKIKKKYESFLNKRLIKRYAVCGNNLVINGAINITGNGKVFIGDNVTIHSDPKVNPTGGGQTTNINIRNGASISIGNNVGISHLSISAYSGISIGDHTLIGTNCMISDTDFHPLEYEKRLVNDHDAIRTAPINIGKNVFIGARSIILKGVTIGDGSIVGAGSVVAKNIPPMEIWAGNPAKFIKRVE